MASEGIADGEMYALVVQSEVLIPRIGLNAAGHSHVSSRKGKCPALEETSRNAKRGRPGAICFIKRRATSVWLVYALFSLIAIECSADLNRDVAQIRADKALGVLFQRHM